MEKRQDTRAIAPSDLAAELNKGGWLLAPGKSSRGIRPKDRTVAKADAHGGWMTVTTGSRILEVCDVTAFRSNPHTMFIRGQIVRTSLDDSTRTAARVGTLLFVQAERLIAYRQLRKQRLAEAERAAVERHRQRLEANEARLRANDRKHCFVYDDGMSTVPRRLSGAGIVTLLAEGGWRYGRGRLLRRQRGQSVGVVEAALVADGHAVELRISNGPPVRVQVADVTLDAPWCLSVVSDVFERQLRPRAHGGGERLVPVRAVVLQLRNDDIWTRMHPKTIAEQQRRLADAVAERKTQSEAYGVKKEES